jgi:hypothetical protein
MDASKIERRIKLKNESDFLFIVTLRLLKQEVWSDQFKEHLKASLLRKEHTGDPQFVIVLKIFAAPGSVITRWKKDTIRKIRHPVLLMKVSTISY